MSRASPGLPRERPLFEDASPPRSLQQRAAAAAAEKDARSATIVNLASREAGPDAALFIPENEGSDIRPLLRHRSSRMNESAA